MKRSPSAVTASQVARRIAEGYGQGTGGSYRPWLLVHWVPSHGLSSRIQGWTTGRVHHLLSTLERLFFLWMDWEPRVVDIREQFPCLPLSDTVVVAERLGVRHPQVNGEPVVMTSDFRLTLALPDGGTRDVIVNVKPSGKLNKRTLEKLELERHFWASRGLDRWLITEHEIPKNLPRNVELVHKFRNIGSIAPLSSSDVVSIREAVVQVCDSGSTSLASVVEEVANTLKLPRGAVMAAIKHLIASRSLCVDMHEPIRPELPLNLR